MGQKVHPGGMRVGVIHDWKSNWYTGNKDFADFLQEDVRIREHIYNKLAHAGLSDILIRKDAQRITIDAGDTISTSPDPSRRHHTKARMGTTKSSSNARPPRSAFRPRCRGSSADSQVEESHRLGISWYWREVMMSCLLAWYGLIGTSSVTPQEHLSPNICRMYKNYAL